MFRNNCGFSYDLNFKKAQDYELWDRMIQANKKIEIIPKPLVMYRYHQNQITKRNGNEQRYFADIVRLRALKRINVDLDDKDKFVYLNMLNGVYPDSSDEVTRLVHIFEQIETNIVENQEYDMDIVSGILQNYYVLLYDYLTTADNEELKNQKRFVRGKLELTTLFKHRLALIMEEIKNA